MREVFGSLVADFLSLVAYCVLTVVLTGAGIVTESIGMQYVASGDVVVGMWFLYFGLLGLFVGLYGFGYRSLVPRAKNVLFQ